MKKILLFSLLILMSFGAQANWKLDADNSTVNFISIKKSTIGEVHHFKSLSGLLKDGVANVSIDLSSVETNISIRNDRMKSMLFDVAKFSSATISTKVDMIKIENMKDGGNYKEKLMIELKLHGVSKKIETTVKIIKLTDNRILVYSENPIIINAKDFDLNEGVEALRKIAKLPVVSSSVPVTFSLTFNQ